MLIIKVGNKRIEQVLKEYRKKVEKTKQLEILRDRKEYEKPSERKRRLKQNAKYKNKWKE